MKSSTVPVSAVRKKKKRVRPREIEEIEEAPIKKKKKRVVVEEVVEPETEDDDVEEVDEDDFEIEEEQPKPKPKKKKKVNHTELKSKAVALRTDVSMDMQSIEMEMQEKKEQQLTDNTWMNTYEVMFKKLKRIMTNVENKVLNSDSGSNDIYALMALYNQMREVIADIRSMMDLTQNTQRIIDQILYPLVRDISNNYVDAIFMINKNLRANVESNKYIELKAGTDECLKEHAKYIQAAYEKSSEKLAKLLEE
jgi:hypothetical protein